MRWLLLVACISGCASQTDVGAAEVARESVTLKSDPGRITCGKHACDHAWPTPQDDSVRPYCCVVGKSTGDPDAQTCENANLGQCESGIPFYCDEAVDCGSQMVCCLSTSIRLLSGCDTRCSDGPQLCKHDSECPSGTGCTAYRCNGEPLGVCGALSADLKAGLGCD
jgi:hypothetical protein